jgi:hypothetical protein
MDESPVRDRIEQLVEEEQQLWTAAGHGGISAEDHEPAPDPGEPRDIP